MYNTAKLKIEHNKPTNIENRVNVDNKYPYGKIDKKQSTIFKHILIANLNFSLFICLYFPPALFAELIFTVQGILILHCSLL